MFDGGVIGALVVVEGLGLRKAVWGTPPTRQVGIGAVLVVGLLIQIGFHTAATAAPSMPSVIALVLAGWVSFILWTVWLSRAPAPRRGDGRDDDGRGSDDDGGGGGGPDGPLPGDGGGDGIDWEEFERQFWPYVERSHRGKEPVAPG
jgi:hypothetical protein